jgi:hypothetical protein
MAQTTRHSGPAMNLDEWFDSAFCRPLARPIARVLLKTNVTANQVTLMSGVLGVVAGVFLGLPSYWPALGGITFLAAMVLDCVDGDIARVKGGSPWRGRFYDGLADSAGTFATHVGMVAGLYASNVTLYGYRMHIVELLVLGGLAGWSFQWNSGVLDGLKQRLKERSVDFELDKYAHEPRNWFERRAYAFIRNYARHIVKLSGKPSSEDYPRFRRVQWVGPTHHHALIAFCGIAAAFTTKELYVLYFLLAIVPANAYLWLVTRGRERQEVADPID